LELDEASKTCSIYPELFQKFVNGRVIDIGAGRDPITKGALIFDKLQGDAQKIDKFFPEESFDTVFSSHCLEHMRDPRAAITSWYKLVKPGGILMVIVPDEDLYEQGHFPSLFNDDHKSTFTISKSKSWSPVSINCLDLCNQLGGEVLYLAQQSDNYVFKYLTFNMLGIRKIRYISVLLRSRALRTLAQKLKMAPLDQTSTDNSVLAQNVFVIRKTI
jgi:ubiquinone/menaquinone biosynthesis C-methylase UbiE